MDMMREAIKRRRMKGMSSDDIGTMHGDGNEPSEHEESGDVGDIAPPSAMKGGKVGKDNAAHEEDGDIGDVSGGAPMQGGKVQAGVEHEETDDDMDMINHLTGDMNDHDMEYSMKNKPRSLGERVRQMAVLKASKLK